jgi:hypothetical protein
MEPSPTSGVVPAGGSLVITISFNTVGLIPGTYEGSINIRSNDQDENCIIVPVCMTVEPVVLKPDLIVEDIYTDPADFGPGDPVRVWSRIRNAGDGPATGPWTILYLFDGAWMCEVAGADPLAAGASCNAECIVDPWPDCDWHGVTVAADMYDEIAEWNEGNNERSERYRAQCPRIAVTPPEIDITLDPGGSTVVYLWIANRGDDTLTWLAQVATVPWMTIGPPTSGTVPPGSDVSMPVTLDASVLSPGQQVHEIIEILHNDPVTASPVEVPVTLTVSGTKPCRELPDRVVAGATFDVTVTFEAPGDDFNAIGIEDAAPAGWTVQVDPSWCTPAADESNLIGTTARYASYGPCCAGTPFVAVSGVTVPPGESPGLYPFSGVLGYRLASEPRQFEDIVCDTTVEVFPGIPVVGTTREVICDILPGVSVCLDLLDGECVVSEADGSFILYAPAEGTYEVTASKAAFKDRTQEIMVTAPGPVTCNFEGDYGLIPCSPDIWYALDCVNLWKFPYPPCGLTMWTALDVVNAWKFPGCSEGTTETSDPSASPGLTDQAGPARVLPAALPGAGETFQVEVTFAAAGGDFNAIGLEETIPGGWMAQVDKGWCTPAADESNIVGGLVQYAWYGPYAANQTFSAVYEVTVPAGAEPMCYPFTGMLGYRLGGASRVFEPVGGDMEVCPAVERVLMSGVMDPDFVEKDTFQEGETVCVYGEGFDSSAGYTLWIQPYVQGVAVAEGDSLDLTACPTGFVPMAMASNADGTIGPVALWPIPAGAELDTYWEIVADRVGPGALAGQYNSLEDGLDAVALDEYGFYVVPEVMAIVLFSLGLCGLGGYYVIRRRRYNSNAA